MEGLVHYLLNALDVCLGYDQCHDIGLKAQSTPHPVLAHHHLLNKDVNPVHLGAIQNALDCHIVLCLDSTGITDLGQHSTTKLLFIKLGSNARSLTLPYSKTKDS